MVTLIITILLFNIFGCNDELDCNPKEEPDLELYIHSKNIDNIKLFSEDDYFSIILKNNNIDSMWVWSNGDWEAGNFYLLLKNSENKIDTIRELSGGMDYNFPMISKLPLGMSLNKDVNFRLGMWGWSNYSFNKNLNIEQIQIEIKAVYESVRSLNNVRDSLDLFGKNELLMNEKVWIGKIEGPWQKFTLSGRFTKVDKYGVEQFPGVKRLPRLDIK